MKILHTVESYYPSIGGMQEVVRQLSERLVKLGHKITVATSSNPGRENKKIGGVDVREFDIKGNMVYGISGEVDKYREYILESKFDIIVNFAAQQWATDTLLPMLDQIKAKKVFVPTGFSGFYNSDYKEYFRKMREWMKKYDWNIFLSENYRDINFARKAGVKKYSVIPNGADENEFLSGEKLDIRKKMGIPRSDFLILLVGSHTGAKGHKEAIEIFSKSNIRDSTLVFIGNYVEDGCWKSCKLSEKLFNLNIKNRIKAKRLIINQFKRKETISFYKQADLFLFPSNIECSPLVLFEAMASKTPFLTTDVGNAREIVNWSGGGLILPTKKDNKGYSHAEIAGSVNKVEYMYKYREERKKMALRGFNNWKKKFTWEKISFKYDALYKNIKTNE